MLGLPGGLRVEEAGPYRGERLEQLQGDRQEHSKGAQRVQQPPSKTAETSARRGGSRCQQAAEK